MISIRKEIETSVTDEPNNILKAPHTLAMLTADTWLLPYSREKAAYPLEYVADNKFWPSVRRVDETYGDRNLICSCAPIEAYVTLFTDHSKMPRTIEAFLLTLKH
jgi:glycine dehydrogenase